MSTPQHFRHDAPFLLERGGQLPYIQLAYHTYGHFHPSRSRVIWVCHSLTANAEVTEWWGDLVGTGKLYDPKDCFIVCANVLGSCYGSTGPANAPAGYEWHHFPDLTIGDMVRAFDLLRVHLGITHIDTLIGGSSGGKQALEWGVQQPSLFSHVIAIAASARQSAWAIAQSATQQMAIALDPTWAQHSAKAGVEGLKVARAMAMMAYRHHGIYGTAQQDSDGRYVGFSAASYQQYQGEKFVARYDAHTYMRMLRAMDAYDLGRHRGGTVAALRRMQARVLSIGLNTDVLFPTQEQRYIALHALNGAYAEVVTPYGHDGFLVEQRQIAHLIRAFYRGQLQEAEATASASLLAFSPN